MIALSHYLWIAAIGRSHAKPMRKSLLKSRRRCKVQLLNKKLRTKMLQMRKLQARMAGQKKESLEHRIARL